MTLQRFEFHVTGIKMLKLQEVSLLFLKEEVIENKINNKS